MHREQHGAMQSCRFQRGQPLCWVVWGKTLFSVFTKPPFLLLFSSLRPTQQGLSFRPQTPSLIISAREFELGMFDGSWEDRDQKNRQCQQQASHLLQAPNRLVQEGSRTLHSLWLRGCRHSVFEHWQALRVFQFRVRLLLFNTPLHVLLLFTIPSYFFSSISLHLL